MPEQRGDPFEDYDMKEMKTALDFLVVIYGTHKDVADSIGYTERQYWKLRKKVDNGEKVSVRFVQEINLIISRIRGVLR